MMQKIAVIDDDDYFLEIFRCCFKERVFAYNHPDLFLIQLEQTFALKDFSLIIVDGLIDKNTKVSFLFLEKILLQKKSLPDLKIVLTSSFLPLTPSHNQNNLFDFFVDKSKIIDWTKMFFTPKKELSNG